MASDVHVRHYYLEEFASLYASCDSLGRTRHILDVCVYRFVYNSRLPNLVLHSKDCRPHAIIQTYIWTGDACAASRVFDLDPEAFARQRPRSNTQTSPVGYCTTLQLRRAAHSTHKATKSSVIPACPPRTRPAERTAYIQPRPRVLESPYPPAHFISKHYVQLASL